MHKLTRGTAAPSCLQQLEKALKKTNNGQKKGKAKNVQPPQNVWGALVTPAHKDEIWEKLKLMQGKYCAYCEMDISGERQQHIEHFRQQSRYPQGVFEWKNLFGSCKDEDSCGKHKDRCIYNDKDLLKPDEDDPEKYLLFVKDGTITPRHGLNEDEQRRAEVTLRVFNLKVPRLSQQRKEIMSGYLETLEQIHKEISADPRLKGDYHQYLEGELEKAKDLPFATAIKHALTSQVVDAPD